MAPFGEQQGEDGALQAAAQLDDLPVDLSLERPKHPQQHHAADDRTSAKRMTNHRQAAPPGGLVGCPKSAGGEVVSRAVGGPTAPV